MHTPLDFSVAIRTYNRSKDLSALLQALSEQQCDAQLRWEVLIVDNNSTDDTAAVVRQLIDRFQVPVRYVKEVRQGASFARMRAVDEARGTLIGFLDDDNRPAKDWVQMAYRFAQSHPRAAAIGSQVHGRYEVTPPPGFERIAGYFPVVERSRDVCFTAGRRRLSNHVPPGAGLVVRRELWQAHVPDRLHLRGPVGQSLARKGEDTEALLHLKQAGWEIWFHADMHIDHVIPPERFERAYLMAFFAGIGRGRSVIRMVSCPPRLRWLVLCGYWVNDVRKWLLHKWRYRQSSLVALSLVTACERQLLLSTMMSPFAQLFGRVSRLRWPIRLPRLGRLFAGRNASQSQEEPLPKEPVGVGTNRRSEQSSQAKKNRRQ